MMTLLMLLSAFVNINGIRQQDQSLQLKLLRQSENPRKM